MMNNYGFVRVAAAAPKLKVADCNYNTNELLTIIDNAQKEQVSVLVFPEMCITAYTCADLFHQRFLLDEAKKSLLVICDHLLNKELIVLVGMPLEVSNKLYNVAAVLFRGQIIGFVPKTYMPNYGEFYDKRWFSSSSDLKDETVSLFDREIPISTNLIFETTGFNFGIEICEDLWTPIPPSSYHALNGADLLFNLSASPENVGKHGYRQSLIMQQSARCMSGYVYASAGCGESSTDLVFAGACMIAENGVLLKESERFSLENQLIISDIDIEKLRNKRLKNTSFELRGHSVEPHYHHLKIDHMTPLTRTLYYKVDPMPFVPSGSTLHERCAEIFQIQTTGLAKRMLHTHCQTAVIGVSGGLDSTLALLVLISTFDKLQIPRKNILGITMPGFGTTDRTYTNAIELMKSLGVTAKEISIVDAVNQHFKDIEQDATRHDITYENSQARERTQLLMDYANKINGLVIGTGDLSESALGWCTYNGDHMSMYAVNSGVPKTLVKALVSWVATNQLNEGAKSILNDVLNTPVSPELLPATSDGKMSQVTEDFVGPYLLHDFFLYNILSFGFSPQKIYYLAQIAFADTYSKEDILRWLRVFYKRFFSQQFKRSCMPDGPKVGSINLSPRGDWRMPSDASFDSDLFLL